jgi:NAD-dependent DNA ligase
MWDETDKLAVLNRLRRNVIVHSVIYYRFNRNLIGDGDYDQLCVTLDEMQKANPELCKAAVFPEDFENYDRSTGMNFMDHDWGIRAAEKLLRGGKHNG